ncbi:AAA family ATPase [Haloimpatiens sp. FM7330]|uniref:AAA family ATPase n=1 Tax=Haloimpatiens sp. FM7330 TaxID=3298610 RepID=UPI00362E91B3
MDDTTKIIEKIICNIGKVVIGKDKEIKNILKAIIANGHVLIEDIPGVGKTTLVKALAKSFNLSYNRIQFTPDLIPSDITGVSIYNQKTMEFEFKKGPIFANIILADEINRTSPKTQSALLEVMEEKQISEGNNVYKLQKPFLVLATQNPIEYEGTFSLPEAQLDRFIIKAKIGYVNEQDELKILKIYKEREPIQEIGEVASCEDIIELQKQAAKIYVSDEINRYIVKLVNTTRNHKYLLLGASTRAALALLKISQASALIDNRQYVIPEDIKENAISVLSHRLILTPSAKANNYTSESIIKDILNTISIPKVN